ncbi:MAG: translation initiation factor IF-6 [Candidatus Nitrosocaldus sp.]|nr:translation initiation factor IF-6 [Candidatus Nitrosocaldus sp.]MCS7141899.1 translation initiation factor IF-6 [Candidatus Nitrosocaldus sp.]MDW8000858.1 translation initiation factor IF-6 [Candidatus Nitrosocaldus sp.]MDW8275752.1 translation initiation factor IF-6 [Candidatus Nitrosocaldus sp.]
MSIYKYRVYRSANIGIFIRSNDEYVFIPKGFAHSKASRLEEFLSARSVRVSIAHTRLLGPLMVANNHGIVVAGIIEDDELSSLQRSTGLNVARLNSRLTAVGNLVAANDRAAIVSTLLDGCMDTIQDALGVKAVQMSIASYHQVGAVLSCTNNGAVVHPNATDEEIERISSILEVDVEPATVNGGVPFVSSGIVANSKAVVVGSLTTGPEMVMLSRAFKA